VNVKGSYVFVDFTVLDTQDDGEMALILGRPFLRYVNARIDVGAEKIQFCIRQRNMTFKIHEKEEQCCLVQNEESREWRKPQPQYKEDEVAPTKPKVDSLITAVRKHWEQDKAFKGRHKPKKSKAIKKARGGKKTETKNTSAKASPTSTPLKKTKRVWHVKEVSSVSSTQGLDQGLDESKLKQMEESRSRTLNYGPSPLGKPASISYFPSNIFISWIKHI
jgi:hypothetical protein